MSPTFDLLFFILFAVAFAAVVADSVRIRIINKKLTKDVAQGLLDLFAYRAKLDEAIKNNESSKIEETEGFLKFVSQSRDWAFQYIERVQIAIKKFQDVFHPIAVQYYKDKEQPINQEEFGELFAAYKKLVEELPDEGKE